MTDRPPPRRTLVMGIVNVTTDSFSDGGCFHDSTAAIGRGRTLAAEGADYVDVGGESTRPGASRVPIEDELARVLPVVEALVADGIAVSVDTMRAEVARQVVGVGATMINDVSGGLADPTMWATVAGLDVTYIAMHWRAHSAVMQSAAVYADVVADVSRELLARAAAAQAAGIRRERIILDPGIGFAKTPEHNWTLLRAAGRLGGLGFPVLWGVSRKRFLGDIAVGDATRPPADRDAASVALTAYLAGHGAWGVRTHTAREHVEAAKVYQRLNQEDA